ncbi:hypothetical protein QO206_15190 [Leeuwenhoekiella aequorea]|uniref:hypothetical protein n=1 Tax=Leeuwenhoekiella aequorea TaxID=283736 RepID=UPI00352D8692|tara:strand:+ start:1490 stop:2401 length:912 start_codon:yes stop_codon:yes gene_type:complete
MSNAPYIKVPVCLLKGIFENKEKALNIALIYGIVDYAFTIKVSKENIIKQLYYDYKRGKLCLDLKESLEKLESIDDEAFYSDYDGFEVDGFTYPEGFDNLVTEENLYENASINYRLHIALNYLNISKTSKDNLYNKYERICSKHNDRSVFGMVNIHHLFTFRDEDKSIDDIFQLCAYIGAKSIIGTKEYIKTNKEHLFARIFGFKKADKASKEEYHKMLYEKYSKRYQFDILKVQLENWGFYTYSYKTRGFYLVDKNKLSLEQLLIKLSNVPASKSKKQKIEEKRLREKKARENFNKSNNSGT